MFRTLLAAAVTGLAFAAVPAAADTSPTLMIESMPTNAPGYRRMVRVHYIQGGRVSASYQALNRTEFTQVPGTADAAAAQACASGAASRLSEIDAFQKAEARRARRGEAPESVRFCIRGVGDWQSRNKDRWLDPIFEGMPYTANR